MSARHAGHTPAQPEGTYWVEPGRLLAGEYPGSTDPDLARSRIDALLAAGIDYFVDLTWPGELPPYDAFLPSPYALAGAQRAVVYSRRPIRDHGLPREPLHMLEILDEIDAALRAGNRVYVHCRAGIGRTGTVVGCHLARRLGGGAPALAALEELWVRAGRDRVYWRTPETEEQIEYVRGWSDAAVRGGADAPRVPDAVPRAPAGGVPPAVPIVRAVASFSPALSPEERLHDAFHGLVVGLAVGDALGMPVQNRRAGTFLPIGDFVAGGPFDLPRGAWTDDTALALALAESLVERDAFDARDQVARYARWQRDGEPSSTGKCVGISPTTAKALAQAKWSGNPFAGSHDPARAEKEPLVRAGIVAAWAWREPERAVALAADAARTTHQAPLVLDACRYYAALVVGALRGASRETLLAPNYSPVPGLWERRPLRAEIAAIAAGGWSPRAGARPHGGGNAADGLATLLWLLGRGAGFREIVLMAVNLGHDSDTNGALAGQIGGALYGHAAIPAAWRTGLLRADLVAAAADRLLRAALRRTPAA